MKRFERPRTSTTSKPRTSSTLAKKDQKQQPTSKANGGVKPLNAAQLVSRVLDATASDPSSLLALNDSTTGSESSEVYENMNLHYMDDANEKPRNDETLMMVDYGDESGTETNNDSVSSSQAGDVFSPEDKKSSRVPKSRSSHDIPLTSKGRASVGSVRSRSSTFHGTARKTVRSSKSHQAKALSDLSSYRSSSENKKTFFAPEAVDDASFEDAKEDDKFEDALNNNTDSDNDNDNEVVHVDKEGERNQDLTQKIGTLESRIERLEEELREVATLEMSLYSVFPEHGSSEHELHRPARDLSRLYALARKNQSENKLISVAKNIVSGLYLVLKSCGSDVPRLTFWLSNTVMLREIISHEFGGTNQNGSNRLEEDWTDARTLIASLRRVESCLFTNTVGSIWSQVMMVHMRSPQGVGSTKCETMGNFSEPSTCDRLQESFSLNLWKKAFEEALQRLCPVVQAARCGCLNVLTRMVMEECISKLDVAMFNAILRESAHQIPTDPDSDPISDPRVLPIPAGVLSFESGVKLKNTVGYWSRLLTDIFEIDDDHSEERGEETFKPFHFLNELSDLLMLPKEMLVDSSTRDEVCPSIGLSLIKRILCNFTPDEFCPYPVPGTVLEELNAQSIIERRSSSGDAARDFPRQVAPVEYCLPSSAQLTDMVAEFSDNLKVSMIQNIVYNNEEVDTSRSPPYYKIIKGVEEKDNLSFSPTNERYRLLGEI